MVSPDTTVMAVPPSQLQLPIGAGLGGAIAPVTSEAPDVPGSTGPGFGVYEAMPLPPPATPELRWAPAPLFAGGAAGYWAECAGRGALSTRWTGAADPAWIDPVASGALLPENGF